MQDIKREEKLAAAKRKLKQFKQKRGKGSKTDGKEDKHTPSAPMQCDTVNLNFRNQKSLRDEILATTIPDGSPSATAEDLTNPDAINQVTEDSGEPTTNELRKNTPETSDENPAADVQSLNGVATEDPDNFSRNNNVPQDSTGNVCAQSASNGVKSVAACSVSLPAEADAVISGAAGAVLSVSNTDNGGKMEDKKDDIFERAKNVSDTQSSASTRENSVLANGHDSASTTESLLQISAKLNGIATEVQAVTETEQLNGNSAPTAGAYVVSELECRNQQLAEQLATIVRQKQDLLVQVDKLAQQVNELHGRLEAEKQQMAAQNLQEQNVFRQQIQAQMQTIGILVAEKQELQHKVHEAQSRATRDQHARQRCQDELQDLKVRSQMLERELASKVDLAESLTATKQELESERKKLQLSVSKLTKSSDETEMHRNELSQKLTAKEIDCQRLNAEVNDLHEKLAMAEVLLQQLSSSSGESAETQVSQLQSERESLNQKLIEYQQAFEQLTGEREQLSRQYEDANKQMQTEVAALSAQVASLEKEKSALLEEEQDLREKVKSLEDDDAQRAAEKTVDERLSTVEDMAQKMQELHLSIENLTIERNDLTSKLDAQLRNNERLARLNEEQEQQLSELTQRANDSVVSTEEHQRLLEQLQSEKATISRALTQNKQLKQQLEEMHDGFIKLSNDKMELATALSTLQHAQKDMTEQNESSQARLADLQLMLDEKNQNMAELQNRLLELQNSEPRSTEAPEEATANNASFHEEIASLQDTVNLLTEQNTHLKEMVTKLQCEVDSREMQSEKSNASVEVDSGVISDDGVVLSHEKAETDSQSESSIRRLEEERAMLFQRIEELEQQKTELTQTLESARQPTTPSAGVAPESHEGLQRNMSLLQERFTKLMNEKVEALNKVEELEHINLQLQSECDTIGEYITLYQNQRQLLKQRHHEKDEYVSAIAQERETMQQKLEKLQALVLTLLGDREIADENLPERRNSPERADISLESEHIATSEPTPGPEWPNMLDDEESTRPRLQSRPDLLPDNAPLTPEDPSNDESPAATPSPETYPGKTQRLEDRSAGKSNAANQIITLLEQMQRPSFGHQGERPQGFCLRYMGQYTAI